MNKILVASIGLAGLLFAMVTLAGVSSLVKADNTKVWVNDFKDGHNERKDIAKRRPLEACECSAGTKLGDSLNYVWNCLCGSKQCVVAGRYDGSNLSCFKFVESLLK